MQEYFRRGTGKEIFFPFVRPTCAMGDTASEEDSLLPHSGGNASFLQYHPLCRPVLQTEKNPALCWCLLFTSQTFFQGGVYHVIPEQQRGLDFLEHGVGPLVSADQSFKSANSAAGKRFSQDKSPPARSWWEASVRGGHQQSQAGRSLGHPCPHFLSSKASFLKMHLL